MDSLIILTLAMLADAIVGDPRWFWRYIPHPVTIFGISLQWLEKSFNTNQLKKLQSIMLGSLSVICLIIFFVSIVHFAIIWFEKFQYGYLAELCFVAILLCHGDLWRRVYDVHVNLKTYENNQSEQQLIKARDGLIHLAGRNRHNLSPQQVASAAIECGAESLCDGIVAPIFYFLLGSFFGYGVECITAYKIINTFDSTIGYRSQRYEYFGKFAAKLDDIANFFPARLCKILIAISALLNLQLKQALEIINEKDSKNCASPNAGLPQSAFAIYLGVKLGGPIAYPNDGKKKGSKFSAIWYNESGKVPTAQDIAESCKLGWRVWSIIIAIVVFIWLLKIYL